MLATRGVRKGHTLDSTRQGAAALTARSRTRDRAARQVGDPGSTASPRSRPRSRPSRPSSTPSSPRSAERSTRSSPSSTTGSRRSPGDGPDTRRRRSSPAATDKVREPASSRSAATTRTTSSRRSSSVATATRRAGVREGRPRHVDATGVAIIPNNFVAGLVEQIAATNIYRDLFNVVNGVPARAWTSPTRSPPSRRPLLQGAYGSNKDVRDFSFNQATATLYTIARSPTSATSSSASPTARPSRAPRRLAKSIGIARGDSTSPTARARPSRTASSRHRRLRRPGRLHHALNSESLAAALGRGIAAMEARGVRPGQPRLRDAPDRLLGDWRPRGSARRVPVAGPSTRPPAPRPTPRSPHVWGVPLRRDPNWPSAKIGTALIIERSEVEIFTGQGYRIDVSSEAGSRFDQNITGSARKRSSASTPSLRPHRPRPAGHRPLSPLA
jgi:hypothetical protein